MSVLDGGEWSGSRSGRFILGERASCTQWVGGWIALSSDLDVVVKRKVPATGVNRTPAIQSVISYCID
jgi:hypothetical protein